MSYVMNATIKEKLLIKPTPERGYIRGLLLFNQTNKTAVIKELIIKKEDGNYTDDFIQLMSDYYLAL